jgi:hypothetical protein
VAGAPHPSTFFSWRRFLSIFDGVYGAVRCLALRSPFSSPLTLNSARRERRATYFPFLINSLPAVALSAFVG